MSNLTLCIFSDKFLWPYPYPPVGLIRQDNYWELSLSFIRWVLDQCLCHWNQVSTLSLISYLWTKSMKAIIVIVSSGLAGGFSSGTGDGSWSSSPWPPCTSCTPSTTAQITRPPTKGWLQKKNEQASETDQESFFLPVSVSNYPKSQIRQISDFANFRFCQLDDDQIN